MEIYIRGFLLLVGVLILTGVAWDIWRRKEEEKKHLKKMQFKIDQEPLLPKRIHKVEVESKNKETLAATIANKNNIDAQTHVNMPISDRPLETIMSAEPMIAKVETSKTRNKQANGLDFIVSLSVVARMSLGFSGDKLLRSLESAGLNYGPMKIFHFYDDSEEPLFSVSLAVEPGWFDLERLPKQHVQGITLFLCVREGIDVNKAFDCMVRTAKQLGFSLNGELRDQEHRPLTLQTIESYRSKLLAYAGDYAVR